MEVKVPKTINANNVLLIARLPRDAVVSEMASAIYAAGDRENHVEKAIRMWYELYSLANEAISRGLNTRDPETLAKLLVALIVELAT